MDIRKRTQQRLERLAGSSGLKPIRPVCGPVGALTRLEGVGELKMFASNDYLGLSNHPSVIAAAKIGLDRFGAGTSGARFICGTTPVHVDFERELAGFLGREAALTFSSGFAANVALISTLTEPGDVIFSDGLNHASLIDGCRMAPAGVRKVVYPHSDMEALEGVLASAADPGHKFILTDGVFSMEGDLATLADLRGLAGRYDATLIIDDAHGIGTLGERGAAAAERLGEGDGRHLITGSLGKALAGVGGGFVAGPQEVIDLLTQSARPQIFSTALPVSSICAAREALRLIVLQPAMIRDLLARAGVFRNELQRRGLQPLPGETAIVPLVLGTAARARAVSQYLLAHGVYAAALSYPAVPEGAARIRFQISRSHSAADLDESAEITREACERNSP